MSRRPINLRNVGDIQCVLEDARIMNRASGIYLVGKVVTDMKNRFPVGAIIQTTDIRTCHNHHYITRNTYYRVANYA